ncbi:MULTISPECIES: hypothetical protein [Nocardioides]|uniref:Uncharacterized protein n=1 Tax=Nocardioides lianchengensis TaxID=1045774 RepID=A0A1G6U2Z0_9ACTN|nr:hypothetical protein [Nocardioides lianchengensis]NYG11549.1 hypothetical protein [Nocardioides lianchengensis]SDD35673.1 hypothetical protein SAMN05421872_107288 [Nocardioides lianchengensis]
MTVFVDRGGLELVSSDPHHDAWQVDLDRIELDVIRAERALENGSELRTDAWDLPGNHGTIPAELRERAEGILARQHSVMERIAEQLGITLRHQGLLDRVGLSSSLSNVPVYLDVSA